MTYTKIIILFTILLSLTYLNCSDSNIVKPPSTVEHGWVVQAPELGIHKYFAVAFPDDNHGWIVGSAGTILHTNDGGINWNKQEGNTEELIFHLQFINQSIGWFCTLSGSIYNTTDGGINWNLQYQEDDFLLRKIIFVDENYGWACGQGKIDDTSESWAGVLLGTIDGGKNWFDLLRTYDVGASIEGAYFIDSLKGWITGSRIRGTFRTEDGGHTWQPLETLSGSINDIIFFNDTVGVSYSRGAAVFKTYDGSVFWNRLPVISNGRWIFDMEFVGDQFGWLVGEVGYINHTTDGGDSWNHQESGTTNTIRSIAFTNENNGWAVGFGGTILHTTDGGANWNSEVMPTQKALADIKMINKFVGCAIGADGTILRTTDGGNKWETVAQTDSVWFYALSTPSDNSWYAVGSSGKVLKSINHGVNWFSISPKSSVTYRDVFFLDDNNGWIVGDNYFFKTTDGGNNWTIDSLQILHLKSIYFLDSANGWFTTLSGMLYNTSDAGSTWSELYTFDNFFTIFDINFITKEHGFVVGHDITFLETNDGGITWEWIIFNNGGKDTYNSIHFTDSLNGWIVGEDFIGLSGVIYKTTDGGTNWELITTAVENPLYSVFFLDNKFGWICGENGTILHTTDGGSEF